MTYHVYNSSLTCHIGLVKNVTLLTAGPPMLTVTQQTPTSPQGEEETQMSKLSKVCFFAAHLTSFLSSLESAIVHRVTSSYPHTSSVNMVASLALVSLFLNLLCSDTSGCFCWTLSLHCHNHYLTVAMG